MGDDGLAAERQLLGLLAASWSRCSRDCLAAGRRKGTWNNLLHLQLLGFNSCESDSCHSSFPAGKNNSPAARVESWDLHLSMALLRDSQRNSGSPQCLGFCSMLEMHSLAMRSSKEDRYVSGDITSTEVWP